MEGTAVTVTGMTETQITEVSSALTGATNGIVDTFVDLLPIIAIITTAIFAINFVSGKFKELKRKRG